MLQDGELLVQVAGDKRDEGYDGQEDVRDEGIDDGGEGGGEDQADGDFEDVVAESEVRKGIPIGG